MIIEREQKRLRWKLIAIGLLTDVAIAAAAAFVFADRGERLAAAFGIWLAIQAAGLALGALALIRLAVGYRLGSFNLARDGFLSALRENGLPEPQAYEFSVDDYLARAADDESAEPKARTTAAYLAGMRKGLAIQAGAIRAVLIDRAHEAALKEYGRNR